jgi:sterol desaturase/sphingolipid hydroxylase (fatty acid hydroxylase superfamily)
VELFYQHEGTLKWALLLLAFVVFALWESYYPRRVLVASTARRWSSHALLSFLCNTLAAWIFRVSAVVLAGANHHGLLNRAAIPFAVRCAVAVLLLDLLRYGQHYMYHAVSFLWRVHQVHHADPDYDWSTSLRFHPGEVLLSQGIYLATIVILGPPAAAVLFLELADVAQNIFVHANVALPQWIDARLRRLVITPDMHRIHHSVEQSDQNTNFGTIFPWWDRLFGTYRHEPLAGDNMQLGLYEVGIKQGVSLLGMLTGPWTAYNSSRGESTYVQGYGSQEGNQEAQEKEALVKSFLATDGHR